MTNIFQCCLTSTFTVKIFENDINNIDELIKSDVSIIAAIDYGKLISRYFEGSPFIGHGKLLKKMQLVEWYEYNCSIPDNNIDYAYMNKYHLTTFYVNSKISEDLPIYRSVKECPVQFVLHSTSFHLDHRYWVVWIKTLVNWKNRAFFLKIGNDVSMLTQCVRQFSRTFSQPEPLQLKQMFSFYFLFGGLSTAFAVFLLDVMHAPKICICKRKRSKHRTHLDFFHQTLVNLCRRFDFRRKHH